MVFESIVADVLNRFVGEYVENLDKKQLKIGIWGGDVVLHNLILKQSALKELDLPVTTLYGHLGKLVLKIPWKNLYSAPVEAIVDKLYLLAVPNTDVRYNSEKEEKNAFEAKKAELARIEQAKKSEEDKDKPVADKTFTEKLTAQIVNNVQIKISDIHIRYEDTTTTGYPFAFGVTLSNLSVHTTDANWMQTLVSESVTKIYKVAQLEMLSVYMNCNTQLFQEQDPSMYKVLFQETIASKSQKPEGYHYIFGPISSGARLEMVPNPEAEERPFTSPKIKLKLCMETLAIGVTKIQFQNTMQLVEAFGRMMRAMPYRSFRPHGITYKHHYKRWWQFAYACILEVEVRRRRKNWSWDNMRRHRENLKSYEEAYKVRLTSKKLTPEITNRCEELEKVLDLQNIVVIRQKIELEVQKEGKKQEAEQKAGWFSSWWGGGAKKNDDANGATDIKKQFEAAMTSDEKAKLFRAIGYQESDTPTELPEYYVAQVLQFELNSLEVSIKSEVSIGSQEVICSSGLPLERVMLLELKNVKCGVQQRPSAGAMKASLSMQELTISGLRQDEVLPIMVRSQLEGSDTLLDVSFETNPEDKLCDQRVIVTSRPLQIIYDAETIIQLAKVFKTPKTATISQLTDAAAEKLVNIKERSATGLQYAIANHPRLELNIDISPSYIIIPNGGLFCNRESVLVLSLGKLLVQTEPRPLNQKDVHSMHAEGANQEEILNEIIRQSYDKFVLEIRDVQAIVATFDEDWQGTLRCSAVTEMHLLEPTSFRISAHLCVLDDDPRLPKCKIFGELPSVNICVTEQRVLEALTIVTGLPLPESDEIQPAPIAKDSNVFSSSLSLLKYLDEKQQKLSKMQRSADSLTTSDVVDGEVVQFIDLEVRFVLNECSLTIFKITGTGSSSSDVFATPTEEFAQSPLEQAFTPRKSVGFNVPFINTNSRKIMACKVKQLEVNMVQRTYDLKVALKLGAVTLDQFRVRNDQEHILNVIQTPKYDDNNDYLFMLNYTSCKKNSPEFATKYALVEQEVGINFSTLVLLLHEEALNELIRLANDFQVRMDAVMCSKKEHERNGNVQRDRIATIHEEKSAASVLLNSAKERLPTILEDDTAVTGSISKDSIKIKVVAKLEDVTVEIQNDKRSIAVLEVQNLTSSAIVKTSYTEVSIRLQDIILTDTNPATIHTKILSIIGDNALQVQVVLYNLEATSDYNSDDMRIEVTMGCARIVFLNWFVTSVLAFLDNFQAAQQRIKDASAAAAEAARNNVVEAYSKATRMKLDIKVKAPIIVIPVDSRSLKAVAMDFGHLSITNNFRDIETENPHGPAVIDDMKIELKDMKLSKVDVCPSDESNVSHTSRYGTDDMIYGIVPDQSAVLSPTSFTLVVKRNLSSGWYRDKPDLDISGRLKAVELNFIATDYSVIMLILSKNMTEGQDEFKKPVPKLEKSPTSTEIINYPTSYADNNAIDGKTNWSAVAKKATAKPFGLEMGQLKLLKQDAVTQQEKEPAKQKVDTFLKFSFQIDSINIKLFTAPGEGLACFEVYYLSLQGKKLTDGSLNTAIILCDIRLDDIRPNRENMLTRLMERRAHSSKVSFVSKSDDEEGMMAPLLSMIDITFNMKESDMFADVKVSSFNLILSVDFLLKIQQFLQPEELAEQKAIQAAEEQARRERKSSTSAASTEKSEAGQMTVIIKIEQPDIILVEKMDDINCYALILNNEISLNVRLVGERQIIKGELKDLCLYYAEFNPETRNDTKHFVIHPCSISLNGSTPEGKGLHLSLNSTNIKISVSPAVIELMNNALTTLSANEQIKLDETQRAVDYSDLWNIQGYDPDEFWFIRPELAEDALSLESLRTIEIKEEKCMVEVPSISLIIETGLGINTMPMLFIETSMQAEVTNWSSDMKINSSLCLSMSYYNQSLALWEYIIEPNEIEQANGNVDSAPWELTFELEVDHHEDRSRDPTTKINIASKDSLEMTVTKTCLDVLQNLGKAFSEAIKREGIVKTEIQAPYTVQNDTGQDIKVNFVGSDFVIHSSHLQPGQEDELIAIEQIGAQEVKSCIIMPNGRLNLEPREKDVELSMLTVMQDNENSAKKKFIKAVIGDSDKELTLPVYKSDKRYFPLYRKTDQEPWAIISEVKIEHGSTLVVLRGIVQIYNHFTAPVYIYQFICHEKYLVGEVRPGGFFNVPLYYLYNECKELHFSMKGYHSSAQGISWKESPNHIELIKALQCDPIKTFEPFYINAVRERHDVFHEVTTKHTMLSACFEIHLKPPLMLRNALPIGLTISVAGCSVRREQNNEVVTSSESISTTSTIVGEDFLDYGEKLLRPGELLHLPTVKTAARSATETSYIVARLVNYLEKDWSCTTEIPAEPPEFSVWTFNAYDSVEVMSLQLGVKYENRNDGMTLIVYCPFWMLNKTGLMLSYRVRRANICELLSKIDCGFAALKTNDENTNILYHPPEYDGPILFSFREKAFFGKKKAAIRVDTGEWSEKFSLDVAGSSGVILCQANNMTYQIGVHNTLTHNSLTKQIVFMPYFVLINRAEFDVDVQEPLRPGDPWTRVKVNDCVPLWPKTEENRTLRLRADGYPEITASFIYTEVQCTLLQLKNRYGGINVDVHVTEGAIYVTFSCYHIGDAPSLIMNHTSEEFAFKEKGDVNGKILMPNQMVLHTWINPAGERKIVWDSGSKLVSIESDLRRDDISEFKSPTDKDIFWVSFLNGTQRVLLVTDNANIAYGVHSASRLDQVTQEIKIEIHGVGLSLVNNSKQCDLMYIGIASSGVIWEECKKSGRFKQMKIQETFYMENTYQQFLRDMEIGVSSKKKYFLEGEKRIEIDFHNNIIKKSTDRAIKRTFYPGVWLEMKSSSHQLQFHAKINRIQIDNQLTDCIFPVVLAPIPPPKSVAATTEFKPFIEMSMVQRIIPHSNVKQFKYLRVLMQEFHVKVDLLFINEICEMISTDITEAEAKRLFAEDLKVQTQPLHAHVAIQSQAEVKNFYDNLHLGPLKIHVSFSMAGSESKALPGILSTILQGVGVTLTDINDVVFRLAFFEREFQFLTQRQLVSECVAHYSGQAVKQLYVLVLGLDVIGNPYGLVVGFTKGVEDLFYEPFQGAIQGPGEFAEGLVLGVRSLFGHTVGGAAGAVSKITGAMGKGLAALTFDDDYQRKRRDALNKKPASLQEGIARSGKGLVMGVFDGVTGVFTKPISGAKEEGVEGFFKGLGKGAVGLVARPIAGVTDFASGSFDAVKRATELSDEAIRLRPPRFLHKDGIVRSYNKREAEGNKLLKEIDKGKFTATDTFVFYDVVVENKDIVVLTDCRIIYAIKSELFGGWQCEWSHRWTEVLSITILNDGVEMLLRSKDSKSAFKKMFSSSGNHKKIVLIPHAHRRNRLMEHMERLRQKAE
ncbi:intermembrane lipid transfer protein Vps13 isoform X3 [Toxorhynchites rutilus septentrionalis]|uniref:intermembrane lipid transfer protein Vps13 isoform X3 n=1 Tax=Toxorhynchites rutilus septentrionalis TaxID=329112 RepID=UPI00247B21C4|nr:intermembrane lipid transfer protein Vps13 isoform X3 [Toxorhynchites rutilus septentrionalis]